MLAIFAKTKRPFTVMLSKQNKRTMSTSLNFINNFSRFASILTRTHKSLVVTEIYKIDCFINSFKYLVLNTVFILSPLRLSSIEVVLIIHLKNKTYSMIHTLRGFQNTIILNW